MNLRTSAPALASLIIACAGGSVAPATAQPAGTSTKISATVAPTVDFRTSKWLSKREVVNNNGEEIADVSDLILDRGAGRIEYLVVKTGKTFGMGGRSIAIPYASFRWEAGKDRLVLAATEEQLKQFPEFSTESWKVMKESKLDDRSALRKRLEADAAAPSDPYAGNLDAAKRMRVEGEIKSVERVRTSTFGEQVVIGVQVADGTTKRVALGPSWYVNGAAAAPMRGDKVVVETIALPRDPDQLLAATEFRNTQNTLQLRGSDGSPAWALKSVDFGGQHYSTPYSRYLLLSDLSGKKIDCRGSELGKVHEIILDRNSGDIAFLSVDPNQNFLGINDTKRLVPWSVATVMLDGTVRIDASKEMVLASPETPSDPTTLDGGAYAERVYNAFNVPAPRFDAPKHVSAVTPESNSAWSGQGSIIRAIERDSAKSFEGEVIDVSEIKFEDGTQPARTIKVRINGNYNGEESFVLGPTWYMANQQPGYVTGDVVKVDARRTMIDGHQHWIAKSVECKNKRVVLLDGENMPAWEQR